MECLWAKLLTSRAEGLQSPGPHRTGVVGPGRGPGTARWGTAARRSDERAARRRYAGRVGPATPRAAGGGRGRGARTAGTVRRHRDGGNPTPGTRASAGRSVGERDDRNRPAGKGLPERPDGTHRERGRRNPSAGPGRPATGRTEWDDRKGAGNGTAGSRRRRTERRQDRTAAPDGATATPGPTPGPDARTVTAAGPQRSAGGGGARAAEGSGRFGGCRPRPRTATPPHPTRAGGVAQCRQEWPAAAFAAMSVRWCEPSSRMRPTAA